MQCAFCGKPAVAKIEDTPMCADAIIKLHQIRRRKRLLAACVSFLASILLTFGAQAAEWLTTRPLPTDFMISPPTYTGALSGPLIGNFPARWHIAQWGTRDPFTMDRIERRPDGWQLWSAEASLTLTTARDGRKELLFQQTSVLPAACYEIDLFIEPNSSFFYPLSRPGIKTMMRSLAQFPRLIVTFTQEIVEAWSGSQCPVNVNGAGIGLVFVNLTTTPPQAFFYQVATYESRGALFEGEWFYTGWLDGGYVNFGVVDSPEHFGYRGLQPGAGMAAYDLNLLARVQEMITSNTHGMERDLSRWFFRGFYIGTAINGEARILSRVGKVRIYSE